MSAHTPKPWVAERGGCIRSAAPEAGRQYARGVGYPQIALVTGLHEGRPEGEREANERLICAAPDLLDALSDAPNPRKYGAGPVETERFFSDFETWRVVARAAIEKAGGK